MCKRGALGAAAAARVRLLPAVAVRCRDGVFLSVKEGGIYSGYSREVFRGAADKC